MKWKTSDQEQRSCRAPRSLALTAAAGVHLAQDNTLALTAPAATKYLNEALESSTELE